MGMFGTNFIINNNLGSGWHHFNSLPVLQNSYNSGFLGKISRVQQVRAASDKRPVFTFGAVNNLENNYGVANQYSFESSIDTTTAKGKAAAVAESLGQGISFLQSSRFVEDRLPGQADAFYNAVTSIGIDNPGELSSFLFSFSNWGVASGGQTADNMENYIYAAQHISEKAPGALSSFIQSVGTVKYQSADLFENYLSRAVEVADTFGAGVANKFAGAFRQTPRTELMDEFFAASDEVMAYGKDTYETFIENISQNAQMTFGNSYQLGTYLEYTASLAKAGDAEALNQFLNNPVSSDLFSPLFNAGGVSTVVTGIDTELTADAKEFGSTQSTTVGLGASDSYSGENTAGVSLSTSGFGMGKAVSAVYQTFEVAEGNHVTGNQNADVSVNLDYDVRYSTWNPLDLASTIAAPIAAGVTAAEAAAKEAAEQGIKLTAKELAGIALKEGAKEAVSELGEAAASEIVEDALASDADDNFEGNVTIMAYLVEKDAQGNSVIIGEQEVERLNVDTNMLGLPQSDQGFGVNTNITFEDVELKPGYEYGVVLAVQGTVGSATGDFTEVSGHVQMNEIKVDFDNNMKVENTVGYEDMEVASHGTYSGAEVAEVLVERRRDEFQEAIAPISNNFHTTIQTLQDRLNQVIPTPERLLALEMAAETESFNMQQLFQQSAVSMLSSYQFGGEGTPGNVLNLFM